MTDHSILRPTSPELPFKNEARVLTNVLSAIFVGLPASFRQALAARDMYEALQTLDTTQLASLGIDRENIGRYAVENAGLVGPKA